MAEVILFVAPPVIVRRFQESCLADPPFQVYALSDLIQAQAFVRQQTPAVVVVVDPKGNGQQVCEQLRKHGTFPLIYIGSKDATAETIAGILDRGADDYVPSDVTPRELRARIRAHLRRARDYAHAQRPVLSYGPLEVDRDLHEVRLHGTALFLSPKEFALMEYFVLNADRVVRREELLQQIWEFPAGLKSRTVDVHISRLRRKLGAAGRDVDITTIPGVGYKLSLSGE
ncbi:MAG: response regulator transcription factor [Armatimonadetes bacterium]|nr:response regulator transcription factor [Armatimonadota bacterium]